MNDALQQSPQLKMTRQQSNPNLKRQTSLLDEIQRKEELLRNQPGRGDIGCFRIFVMFNIFFSLVFGIACLTVYPDLNLFSESVFVIVCVYMVIELLACIASISLLGLFVVVNYALCCKRLYGDYPYCNIGWFPLVQQILVSIAYIVYIPLGLDVIINQHTKLPLLIVLYLLYQLIISVVFLGRGCVQIFDKRFVSSHIMEMEEQEVYKVDEEKIADYKREVLDARNEWIRQQSNRLAVQ